MVYINEEEGYVQESEAKKRGLKVAKLGYGVPAAAEVRRGHPRVVCLQVRRGHPPEGRRQCLLLNPTGTSALAGDFPFFHKNHTIPHVVLPTFLVTRPSLAEANRTLSDAFLASVCKLLGASAMFLPPRWGGQYPVEPSPPSLDVHAPS